MELKHYIVPSITKNPSSMILHCGINDLMNTSSSPQQISEELKNVATIIKQQSPSCSIYISGVTHQAKYPNLDVNVQQLNDILYNICESNSFHFIDNSNITVDDLDSSGLHLNEKGIAKLACNFRDCIKASHLV